MSDAPALFETMRVRQGLLPLLDRHVRRLTRGSRAVGIAPPLAALAEDAVARAGTGSPEGVLRVVWDGQAATWSERPLPADTRLRVVTVAEPHPGYPVKSVSREPFERALAEAQTRGADEPLLLTGAGRVAEAARFAVAWLDGAAVRLPDLELGVLPSVGIARLLELAAARGVPVMSGQFRRRALEGRPLVLVNAVRGIVPAATLDGVQVPVAELFTGLAAAFWPAA
ncbi:MAG: aminotransferase class IV [Gemmatimonadota bacterium]|nr:aminotransferase class IV [Gemmatimonadota bacterium]